MGSAPEGIPGLGISAIGIIYLWINAFVKQAWHDDSLAWPDPEEIRHPPTKRASEKIENEEPGFWGCGRITANPGAILN
jgi:hypothetical protein